MQMTEEEAKQTQCPNEDRLIKFDRDTGKEHQDIGSSNCCIASQCALWEWVDQPAQGARRRGECGMKRKTVIIMQQQPQPQRVPVDFRHLRKN